MRSLLQISDIHFGPYHLADVTEALLDLVEQRRPDVVVISGDLTQRAKPHQFRAAHRFVEKLEPPVVVVPGNHDVPLYRFWERVLLPYGAYRRHFDVSLEGEYIDAELCIVGINTSYNWTTKHGTLRSERIGQAVALLREAPSGAFKVVVAHHPLVLPELFEGERLARGAARAVASLAEAGAELLLCGHVHQFFLAAASEFYPSLGTEPRFLHCGTTTSSRGRGAERGVNSCNWIEVDAGAVTVRQLVYDRRSRGFGVARTEGWTRSLTQRRRGAAISSALP